MNTVLSPATTAATANLHRTPSVVSVIPCHTARQRRQFETVAEVLHRRDPAFIPPFPGSVAKILSPDSVFSRRHGQIFSFLAVRRGMPVGTIAAIINRTHNVHYEDQTGFFGFFACENNPDTAALLFEAAAAVLRQHGLHSIRGPYNPSINDECGLLTEGFEFAPYLGLTWNPAYYEKLLTGLGFQSVCRSHGLQLPLHRLEPPSRLSPIVARVARRSRLKLRPINLSRLEHELEIIHEVYNNTLKRNWGFIPISMDDLLAAANDMRKIADPRMILIAECDGENAGVALSLPNFNEVLARTKSTPRWLRPLHILWTMKTRPIQSARQMVYGISPRFRYRNGLHAWLIYEQFVTAKARYQNAELGWIEDTNTEILDNSQMLGANQHRTWKIFEKPL